MLTDGSAFFLLVDHDAVKDAVGSIVLVHLYSTPANVTVARAVVAVGTDPGPFAVPLPIREAVRLDSRHAMDVFWFRPVEAEPLDGGQTGDASTSMPDALRYLADPDSPPPGSAPFRLIGDPIVTWSTPVRFQAEADVTFTGPATGNDRHDELERNAFGGPDEGTYFINITGTRLWQSIVALDLQASRVARTRPETPDEGAKQIEVWIAGYRSLDAWRGTPRNVTLERTETLEVDVDYEMGSELPEDSVQEFRLRVVPAYRQAGQGWQGEDLARTITVTVSLDPTP